MIPHFANLAIEFMRELILIDDPTDIASLPGNYLQICLNLPDGIGDLIHLTSAKKELDKLEVPSAQVIYVLFLPIEQLETLKAILGHAGIEENERCHIITYELGGIGVATLYRALQKYYRETPSIKAQFDCVISVHEHSACLNKYSPECKALLQALLPDTATWTFLSEHCHPAYSSHPHKKPSIHVLFQGFTDLGCSLYLQEAPQKPLKKPLTELLGKELRVFNDEDLLSNATVFPAYCKRPIRLNSLVSMTSMPLLAKHNIVIALLSKQVDRLALQTIDESSCQFTDVIVLTDPSLNQRDIQPGPKRILLIIEDNYLPREDYLNILTNYSKTAIASGDNSLQDCINYRLLPVLMLPSHKTLFATSLIKAITNFDESLGSAVSIFANHQTIDADQHEKWQQYCEQLIMRPTFGDHVRHSYMLHQLIAGFFHQIQAANMQKAIAYYQKIPGSTTQEVKSWILHSGFIDRKLLEGFHTASTPFKSLSEDRSTRHDAEPKAPPSDL